MTTPGRDPDAEAAARAWMAYGNCLGVDPDLFFPGRGESTREAIEICATCIVRRQCLDYALTNHEHFGIWGGTSERERKQMRRRRLRVIAEPDDAA